MGRTRPGDDLSRRERQVMEILYRRGSATVGEILDDLPDPPTYSAVRSILRILGEKGRIRHREEGTRYIYSPATPAEKARNGVLRRVVQTYFGGSMEDALTALLRISDADVSEAEMERLRDRIRAAEARERRDE